MGWFSKKPQPTDQWRRQPSDIAIRIEADHVQRECVNRPFVVYDGTVALIFQQGSLLGRLESGKHDIDGPLRKWFVGDHPTVLVLIDDGDLTVDVPITGLYSQENIDLTAGLRLTLTVSEPETFWHNVMKDRRRYTVDEFANHFRPELLDALLAFTATRPIHDLYHNPALRSQMEALLKQRLGASLRRLGLSLVSVNVARITSDQYDRVREQRAGVEIESRETRIEAARREVLQKARENLAADKRHEAVTLAELRDAVNQATHDLGIKDRLREDEFARLSAQLQQDAADFEQQRTQDRGSAAQAHELDLDAGRQSHDREQRALDVDAFLANRLKEAEADQQSRDLERSGEEKDLDFAIRARDAALDARKRKKLDDVEILRSKAEVLASADTATKIALGVGDRETLLELERLESQKGMTPEQLLVLAAEKSEAAAAALAERFRSEGKINQELTEQLRHQMEQERLANREASDRLERVLRESLKQMGQVATAKSESQGPGGQTIVSGTHGSPTIINPRKQGDTRPGEHPTDE